MGCRDPARGGEIERKRERREKVASSFQRSGGCMHAEPTENTDPTCLSPTRRGEDSLPLAAERGRKPAIASSLGHASVANFTPSTRLPFQYSCRGAGVNRPTRHLCTIIEDRIAVATSCFLSETRRIVDLTLPRIHTSRFNPRSPATSHSPYALLPNIFFSFFVRRLAESLR